MSRRQDNLTIDTLAAVSVPALTSSASSGALVNAPTTWLPLLILPAAAMWLRDRVPAWALMWLLAAAVFAGCKWLTWRHAPARLRRVNAARSLAYLVAWPGMDATRFLDRSAHPDRPLLREPFAALAKTVGGAVLLFVVARRVAPVSIYAAGWFGMAGTVLLLHFGTFHLLSIAWRSVGVDARPLMDRPTRAASLADFWGARWNTGFHRLAQDLIFRPAVRRFGPAGATVLTFLASGLVHDLVISVPADGGYGLPTLYFLIQGGGVLFERRALRRRPVIRRVVTIACVLLPAPLLFHPPFVSNVFVPFMRAVGAL